MPQKPLESSAAAARLASNTDDVMRARVAAGAQAANLFFFRLSQHGLFLPITTQIRFGKIRFSEPEPD